jgi:hypothetical protein
MNVLFEGITTQDSAPGFIMEAWHGGLFMACVSTTLAYEYLEVCSGKLSAVRWQQLQPVVGALLRQARFFRSIFRGDRCRRTLVTSMSLTVR